MKEEQFCPQIQKPSMADLSKKGWRLQGGRECNSKCYYEKTLRKFCLLTEEMYN